MQDKIPAEYRNIKFIFDFQMTRNNVLNDILTCTNISEKKTTLDYYWFI